MKRIQLDPAVRDALLDPDNLSDELRVRGRVYIPEAPITAGFKSVLWKVKDEYARPRAAKLAIYEDYEDRSFLREMSLTARLDGYEEFAKFVDAGIVDIDVPGHGTKTFVCFVEEWIDGMTLEQFLANNRDIISSSFFVAYVRGMAAALAALEAQGLRHDDLHSGNVMVAKPAVGTLSESWRLKVIDTGSLKLRDAPLTKERDDHGNLTDHLVKIYNCIWSRKILSVRERRFLVEALGLIRSMLDDDRTIALRAPSQIDTQFRLADVRANSPRASESPALHSPFEYISAEHIADDRVLVGIFAASCPWLEKVSGPDPCLVTGPRGCGKSTIFRWLSLKAHLHKTFDEIEVLRIAGFYVSCSSDLQNRLGWIRTDGVAERFRREIVHYFNLLVSREIIYTLAIIYEREDRVEAWGLDEPQADVVYSFIRESLRLSRPRLQGVARLRQCLDLIETEMFRCHVQILRGLNLEWATPETFLGDLTTLLVRELRFFRHRRIAILLDDYSTHRLPEAVQVVLNRIIWERRDSHIFKLSSEKYGAVLRDSFQATVDIAREMVEVDCGREYVALDDTDQLAKARRFAIELLANRLRAAGYAGTPETLLGHSGWAEQSLGRALRDKTPGRSNDQYHGLECIADLCSGDVSTLLLVYRRIFERGGVANETDTTVAARVQHEAIESVARELLEGIRYHLPYGSRMYVTAREFGNLVRNILEKGRLIKKGSDRVPPMCPRIEVDQSGGDQEDNLNPELEEVARELVRRAVFIEMEPGRSRHNFVTTLRWQLRRVYLPAFGAALSKNDAVKWRPTEFKYFLTDPAGACDVYWQRRQKENEAGKPQSIQGDLYGAARPPERS